MGDDELTPLQAEFEAQKKKTAQTPLQAEFEAQKETAGDRAGGLIGSLAQGATLGFADEALGAIEGANQFLHGGSFRAGYKEGSEKTRAANRKFDTAHPIASTLAEVAGSVPLAVATGAGAVARGASLGQKVAAGAQTGAKFGAVAGAGHAEGGLRERATGAAKGAALGAAGGAVVPVLGAGVGKFADVTGLRTTQSAAGRADQLLGNALKRDELSIPALRQAASDATAATKPRILPDLAGENTKGLARAAQATPSLAKNQLGAHLTDRQAGQLGRITEDLESSLNMKGRDAYEVADEIIARQKAKAAPLYEQAYQHGAVDDPELTSLLKRPAAKLALAEARRMAADEGVRLPKDKTTVQALDYTKRALDDRIASLRQSGDKDKARILTGLKNEILERVDGTVPSFRAARQAFKGEAELNDALEMGKTILKEDSRLSAKTIAGYGDAEKEMYRTGALDAIRQQMEKSPDSHDLVKKLFASPSMRAKLRVLFPDEGSFSQFAKAMEHEASMSRTKDVVLGGPATARIGAELSDMAGMNLGELAVNATMGGGVKGAVLQATKDALRRRAQGVTGNVADQLSQRMLISPRDAVKFSDLLQRLETIPGKPSPTQGRFAALLGARAGAASSR